MKEVAELYGCEKSLEAVEEHRRVAGVEAISSRCFEAARISALLIDDGLKLDKMYGIDWHKSAAPVVGRILRIESLAEQILDEVRLVLMCLKCLYEFHLLAHLVIECYSRI